MNVRSSVALKTIKIGNSVERNHLVKKTRQNAENKQTVHLTGKTFLEGKTRQTAKNKQTFNLI